MKIAIVALVLLSLLCAAKKATDGSAGRADFDRFDCPIIPDSIEAVVE